MGWLDFCIFSIPLCFYTVILKATCAGGGGESHPTRTSHTQVFLKHTGVRIKAVTLQKMSPHMSPAEEANMLALQLISIQLPALVGS